MAAGALRAVLRHGDRGRNRERVGEEAAAKAFIKGLIDFTGPAFLVTLARSVSVVMTNTKTIDTVLHAMEGLVSGASSATFVI